MTYDDDTPKEKDNVIPLRIAASDNDKNSKESTELLVYSLIISRYSNDRLQVQLSDSYQNPESLRLTAYDLLEAGTDLMRQYDRIMKESNDDSGPDAS